MLGKDFISEPSFLLVLRTASHAFIVPVCTVFGRLLDNRRYSVWILQIESGRLRRDMSILEFRLWARGYFANTLGKQGRRGTHFHVESAENEVGEKRTWQDFGGVVAADGSFPCI